MKDTFGREITYLRVSVTERCNLRCLYCRPGAVSRADQNRPGAAACTGGPEAANCTDCGETEGGALTDGEILLAVRAAASLGFRKLRFTGGEPLLRRNLPDLCAQAAAVEGIDELCLTTNGTFLQELARPLRRAGVDRVNVSLDTLDPERYRAVTGGGNLSRTLAGLEAALSAGFRRVKVNAVLLGDTSGGELRELAELSVRYPLDVRFVEWMPMPGCTAPQSGHFSPPSCNWVLEQIPELEPLNRTEGVARLYRLPGARGTVGFIRPVSAAFCADCGRLRLTADGLLKPCLHGPEGFSIRGRDFEGVREQFRRAVLAKPACHGPLAPDHPGGGGRTMDRIGG